ncbi:hypothetical protein MK805_07475 [Shimazuella sp. AN120528]|uniref:hypothetical protein n=1 Tax=Shimazuella soli TaxID=1892854 RepID=UPI001F0E49A9|nr:hypothetical protein [Shimazuella soli]MCH5584812.1 hypothetical protein [Shimazuella soli]
MKFLELPACSYEKYIVKLNVNRVKRDQPSTMDRFVFVFSRCIEESSTYGDVDIELVPEKEVPIFHDALKNAQKREIKDQDFEDNGLSLQIGNDIKIIKNISDFATNYIAVVHNPNNGQDKYHWLLTRNRGHIGKLENRPFTSFSPEFHYQMCKFQDEQEKSEIENSVKNIKDLEGLAGTFEEIVSQLEARKSRVENRTTGDCLRSFYQPSDC